MGETSYTVSLRLAALLSKFCLLEIVTKLQDAVLVIPLVWLGSLLTTTTHLGNLVKDAKTRKRKFVCRSVLKVPSICSFNPMHLEFWILQFQCFVLVIKLLDS